MASEIYPVLDHLKDRYFDTSLYGNVTVDTTSSTVTFPIYSFDHRMVGFQQYNPLGSKAERRNPIDGKYFTILSEPAVWGLESLFYFDKPIVFVCEGIFKAIRFHNHGYPAIATLTNNPKSLKSAILGLAPTVIAILDPDQAGSKLASYGHHYFVPPKPVNDMTELEFTDFLNSILDSYDPRNHLPKP